MRRRDIPLLIVLLLPPATVAISLLKPVTIVTDRVEILYQNTDFISSFHFEVHEAGTANSNLDMTLKLKEVPANDVVVKIRLLKETFGQYTAMGSSVAHNVCDFMKNDQLFYANLRACGNLPDRCPMLKDTLYYAKRYKVLVSEMPPALPTGKWKIECEIGNKSVQISKSEWFGRVMQ